MKNPADAAAAAQGQPAVPVASAGSRPAFVPGPSASYNPNPGSSSFATPPPTAPAWNPQPVSATGATAPLGQLPPAVLALLQGTAQQPSSQLAPPSSAAPYFGVGAQPAAPMPMSYGTPQPPSGSVPSASSGPTSAGVQNPQAMQHLLALLVSSHLITFYAYHLFAAPLRWGCLACPWFERARRRINLRYIQASIIF